MHRSDSAAMKTVPLQIGCRHGIKPLGEDQDDLITVRLDIDYARWIGVHIAADEIFVIGRASDAHTCTGALKGIDPLPAAPVLWLGTHVGLDHERHGGRSGADR